MIAVLSPAKNMDESPYERKLKPSIPIFKEQSQGLMEVMKKLSAKQVGKLMSLSVNLASLNYNRNQQWSWEMLEKEGKPAIFMFNGDVYRGLNVTSLSDQDVMFAQNHLIMLSGLHGFLRPLDRILPYRLEMGSSLKVDRKTPNLYKFWGTAIGESITQCLKSHKEKVIVNLASAEYSKAMMQHHFEVPVIQCHFLDFKNGKYQAIQTWTKLARGAMASVIVKERIEKSSLLKEVQFNGYGFDASRSSAEEFVFTRKNPC